MVHAALHRVDVLESEVFAGPAPTLDAMLRDHRDGTLTESARLTTHTPVANALGWPVT
jgi:aspartyl-tRNA(Asn)/glutamyl-tRNA(Gln) amidotransferase subunit A